MAPADHEEHRHEAPHHMPQKRLSAHLSKPRRKRGKRYEDLRDSQKYRLTEGLKTKNVTAVDGKTAL